MLLHGWTTRSWSCRPLLHVAGGGDLVGSGGAEDRHYFPATQAASQPFPLADFSVLIRSDCVVAISERGVAAQQPLHGPRGHAASVLARAGRVVDGGRRRPLGRRPGLGGCPSRCRPCGAWSWPRRPAAWAVPSRWTCSPPLTTRSCPASSRIIRSRPLRARMGSSSFRSRHRTLHGQPSGRLAHVRRRSARPVHRPVRPGSVRPGGR